MPRYKLKLVSKRNVYNVGGLKVNTKGYRVTSTSVGGKRFHTNMSRRGVRTTTKIPGTQVRVRHTKQGCLPGCVPMLALGVLVMAVIALL